MYKTYCILARHNSSFWANPFNREFENSTCLKERKLVDKSWQTDRTFMDEDNPRSKINKARLIFLNDFYGADQQSYAISNNDYFSDETSDHNETQPEDKESSDTDKSCTELIDNLHDFGKSCIIFQFFTIHSINLYSCLIFL